ncbi:adenosylcobinamide-GDP ribazoletransferase [Peptacetobacter sp.]|uniref:adenosylcobinamide-GDP ribazoletransferase n=1 Tax=Peptacetobacter sp. TaxID=2991975 RepID=UPI00260CE4CA|nr:adenosylcobinamide-GDP ribazoletransferase [Peptacetobacter sp.]
MKRFLNTLRFLTRIPVRTSGEFDEEFYKGMYYFPLIGFIIGLIMYVVSLLLGILLPGDALVISIMVVFLEVIITGGLHLDGLGDTADAFFSNRDKEKMLEIMKDSRLGTNSLLAILFNILIKVGIITTFLNRGMSYMIVAMPAISRLVVILLAKKTESPRENGMGNVFIGKATNSMIIIGFVYTMIILAGFLYLINGMQITGMYAPMGCIFIGIVITALVESLIKKSSIKKIGGITGDVLGYGIEVAEIVFIIVVYISAVLLF